MAHQDSIQTPLPANPLSAAPSQDLADFMRFRETAPPETQRLLDIAFAVGASTVHSALEPAIKELKGEKAELESQARYEPLTGLLTRPAFMNLLDKTIAGVHNGLHPGKRLAVIRLDLKDFKQYNDKLGEHIGDVVLDEGMAKTLKTVTRVNTKSPDHTEDFAVSFRDPVHNGGESGEEEPDASRYGGDEFALLVMLNENYRYPEYPEDDTETSLARQVDSIKQRIKDGFKKNATEALERRGIDISTLPYPIDTSAGGVLLQNGETAQDLMIRGDFAMKADKESIAEAHGGAYREIK